MSESNIEIFLCKFTLIYTYCLLFLWSVERRKYGTLGLSGRDGAGGAPYHSGEASSGPKVKFKFLKYVSKHLLKKITFVTAKRICAITSE